MKRALLSFLIVTVIMSVTEQGGITAVGEKTKFYQMTYQTENVIGTITINGFVVTEMKEKSGNGTTVLNPWLIGDNELKAEVKKGDPAKTAELVVGLSELVQGDVVSTTDKGKLFSLELKNNDFGTNGNATAAKKFKSIHDFKKHLSEAGEAKQSDILAYAKKFYSMFAKKDADGILRESAVKIEDYSRAFGGADMKTELRRYLTDELFKSKLGKLNPAALRAVQVGPTKKIWHIFNDKDELIKAKSADGSTYELAVYIALLDGKLKVVR